MSGNEGQARKTAHALSHELRTPTDQLARSLHRLSISQLTTSDTPSPDAAQLIRRARALTTDLQRVIEEIIALATPSPSGGRVERLEQERLVVRDFINDVVLAERISPRPDIVAPPSLMLNTHTPRLREIVTELVGIAQRRAPYATLSLAGSAVGLAVAIDVRWKDPAPLRLATEDPESGVPHVRALVSSLGGRLESLTGEGKIGLRALLPQQRAQDLPVSNDAE
jgi:hypothetical protein